MIYTPPATDKTKARIQELVPEVMELKFGCEVRHVPVKDRGIDYRGIYLHPARGKRMHLIYFEGERTGSQLPYSTTISEKEFEIIGSSITFAVVLRAIDKAKKRNRGSFFVRGDGTIFEWEKFTDGGSGHHGIQPTYVTWNLTQDWDGQTQEMKDFIGKLLGI